MLVILLLYLGLCQAQAQDNVTGALDGRGVCHCTVHLPDTSFPIDRLIFFDSAYKRLNVSVQEELTNIQHLNDTLNSCIERLNKLTERFDGKDTGALSELNFMLLKMEIQELQTMISDLKFSLNGSNSKVDSIFVEIHKISSMVNQLEKYDKHHILAAKKEIDGIRERLEECKTNRTHLATSIDTPVPYGSCNHGVIERISRQNVVQLNWRGMSYKSGGWGKDSLLGANQSKYWSVSLDTNTFSRGRLYSSYDNLLRHQNPNEKTFSIDGNGAGMVLYNNSLYYNCYYSRDLCKVDIESNNLTRRTLPDAAYNDRFSYSSSKYQDFDLASDENGLWVIYSTEASNGNILIGKLDPTTLELEKTWSTSQYKPMVSNAFMVCGVLYATRTLNTLKEEIFYMYDTKTGKEEKLSIPMGKMLENVQSLTYNPNDHKLYMMNDGFMANYDIFFEPLSEE
ncbi:olfactomedin-4-like [Discoglossus pictus]